MRKSRNRGLRPFERPLASVDLAVFTVRDDVLAVLLVRRRDGDGEPFPDRWALPGGFVDVERDADLVACARRKLADKTGVRAAYLEQVGSWGDATRDPRGWSVTQVYFALVPAQDLVGGANTAEAAWVAVDAIPKRRLAFDHDRLLAAALERLKSKVEYTSLPAFLVAEPFTLPQLQRAYEVVLERAIDKSGFRTRALAADFLEEAGTVGGESKRPAMGYRLVDRRTVTIFPRTFSPRE